MEDSTAMLSTLSLETQTRITRNFKAAKARLELRKSGIKREQLDLYGGAKSQPTCSSFDGEGSSAYSNVNNVKSESVTACHFPSSVSPATYKQIYDPIDDVLSLDEEYFLEIDALCMASARSKNKRMKIDITDTHEAGNELAGKFSTPQPAVTSKSEFPDSGSRKIGLIIDSNMTSTEKERPFSFKTEVDSVKKLSFPTEDSTSDEVNRVPSMADSGDVRKRILSNITNVSHTSQTNIVKPTPIKMDICMQERSKKTDLQPCSLQKAPEVTNSDFEKSDSPSGSPKADSTTIQRVDSGKLNEQQQEVVLCPPDIPLLVLAGPGSGKTSTMVARILHMVQNGVDQSKILAMTFTIAAATEMRERIAKSVGKSVAKEMTISTFHSFCLQLCRQHAKRIGRSENFLVYGHSQQRKAVAEAVRLSADSLSNENGRDAAGALQTNVSALKAKAKKWEQFVAQAKAAGRSPDYFEKQQELEKATILRKYEATLAACDALDYSDFISQATRLLTEFPEVLAEVQEKWSHVLVDEFQDTSREQFALIRQLAGHGCLTVVGDDDQSIFGFNGANSDGFDFFRRSFPACREVRLQRNYRSTACIVEAASCLIQRNSSRCKVEGAMSMNDQGEKISVVECRNESAQVAWVVDSILQLAASGSSDQSKRNFGKFAVLYRRQVTGRAFQAAFRLRNVPFNVHGVAFYRRKLVQNIIGMMWSVFPDCDSVHPRRVFKAMFSSDRVEAKMAVEHVERMANSKKQSFLQTASETFSSKISARFTRKQIGQGSRVMRVIETVRCLVHQESSLSALVEAVVSLMPQRNAFCSRAVVDEANGKLLNEDDDPRSVLKYLLDDVSEFIAEQGLPAAMDPQQRGCRDALLQFLAFVAGREAENFRMRRCDDESSVMLTTMHQSKGLEWDHVFIVRVNEMEVPLLHDCRGSGSNEGSASLEEERRLFYVAMTRARKKLFLSYIRHDEHRQVLRESRFLKEIPPHLLTWTGPCVATSPSDMSADVADDVSYDVAGGQQVPDGECIGQLASDGQSFLRRFPQECRAQIASIFHFWAQKSAFKDPSRLLTKVRMVMDERLCSRSSKSNKAVLLEARKAIGEADALAYAVHVLEWMKLPAEQRMLYQAERQEHFQQQGCDRAMAAAKPSDKQLEYLRNLGCTVKPTSKKEASDLISHYKSI